MKNPKEILKKYWGYDDFRDIQADIIDSILEKKDTLALLPTGGGKSICFQVPAMCLDGVCLVISPLISLMKDQVFNLKNVGINAFCATSDIENSILFSTLENMSLNDNIKFLYISPERLKSKIFLDYLIKIKINFIAVDEAHCISQWGHDFRPEYMQIGNIRNLFDVPILALTASATPKVIEEIKNNLNFKKGNIFKKSFERKNLSYIILNRENKLDTILLILKKIEGTSIIYVRNRKKTKEISDWLNRNGFSSHYYHAGLNPLIREMKQEEWKNDKKRIMVATNAFGMGIDKPNVSLVFHIDFADSLESYFQEAGRAGRDGNEAKCIMILNENDIDSFKKKLLESKLDLDFIKLIFEKLNSFYFNYEDENINKLHNFDIIEFIKKYNLSLPKTLKSLTFLCQEEIIKLSDYENISTKIRIICSSKDIINLKESQNKDILIYLLRNYSAILDEHKKINEVDIANYFNISITTLSDIFINLSEYEFIDYREKNKNQTISFLVSNNKKIIDRLNTKMNFHNERIMFRANSIFNYATKNLCRNILLLKYFGELEPKKCGKCDVCKNEQKINKKDKMELESIIKSILTSKKISSKDLCIELNNYEDEYILEIIDTLFLEEKIFFDESNKIVLNL